MAETLGQLIEAVREALSEATESQWDDNMLTRWINDGAGDIARRAEVLQDREDVDITDGVAEYTLPSDVLRIHRVEFYFDGETLKYPLEYRDFQNMDSMWGMNQTTEGTPSLYTLWGFPPALKLVLYPVPSANGTAKVFYYRLPVPRVSSPQTVEVPEGYHDLIVHYAEYRALRRDRDPRWQEAKSLYDEGLFHMIELTRRWSDQAGMIDVGTSHLPAWLVGMEDY